MLLVTFLFCCFRTATKVSEMVGNVNTSSALSAFEKMEEKGKPAVHYGSTNKLCFAFPLEGQSLFGTRERSPLHINF